MAGNDDISLREFIEHKIHALEERLNERFESRDNARSLQAKEYERRLADLNGEQGRLAKDRERFLSLDVFYPFKQGLDDWRGTVNSFMDSSKGKSLGISLVWGIVIACTSIALTLLFHFKS